MVGEEDTLMSEKGELAVRMNVPMLHTSISYLKTLGGDGSVYYVDRGVVHIYQNVSNYILSKCVICCIAVVPQQSS